MPAPIPLDAPVTTATLPFKSFIVGTPAFCEVFTIRQASNCTSDQMCPTGSRIRKDSDFREPLKVGAKDLALQNKIGELDITYDLDQAGRLELFKVMRESGGAHAMELMQVCARHVRPTSANLFQDLISPRLSQSTGDTRKLPIGKPGAVGVCHSSKGSLTGFECPNRYFSARSTHPARNERLSSRPRRLAMPGRTKGVWLRGDT